MLEFNRISDSFQILLYSVDPSEWESFYLFRTKSKISLNVEFVFSHVKCWKMEVFEEIKKKSWEDRQKPLRVLDYI